MPLTSPTVEDIQHLCEEVQALVRAGLPLETHLASAGQGHGRRLQQLTQQMSDSLAQGSSLQETVSRESNSASRMLSAAVAAGVRSGDLATAVEMLGDLAADVADLRRRILHSLAYPLTVVAIAAMLFILFISEFLWRIRTTFQDLRIPVSPWLQPLLQLDQTAPWWPWLFPLLLIGIVLIWVGSGRAGILSFRGPERVLLGVPGVAALVRDLQFYTLSRMLLLLVERQIPLPEALQLAGRTCGSRQLDESCQHAAGAIAAGSLPEVPREGRWSRGQLPPLLQTVLRNAGRQEDRLKLRLAGVAAHYQRRLQLNVTWLRQVIPIAMFIVIGGGTAVLYGLLVFWPVAELYRSLGH